MVVTYPLNNITYSAEDAELYNSARTSGVYATDDNLEYSLTGAMQITIGVGLAWIQNSRFSGKVVANKSAVALSIDAAEASLDRIDRVVLGFNASQNASSIYIKKGAAGSTPIAPARSTTSSLYELVLYDIYVASGTTVLNASMITDQRANDAVCGLMRDAVTRNAPALHAASHALNGSDPITPASIGAEEEGTCVKNSRIDVAGGVAGLDDNGKVTASSASATSVILSTADATTLTLASNYAGKLICVNNTVNVGVVIPAHSALPFPVGTEIEFCRYNSGAVTFTASAGVTLCSVNDARAIGHRYGTVGIKKLSENVWLIAGDIQ